MSCVVIVWLIFQWWVIAVKGILAPNIQHIINFPINVPYSSGWVK